MRSFTLFLLSFLIVGSAWAAEPDVPKPIEGTFISGAEGRGSFRISLDAYKECETFKVGSIGQVHYCKMDGFVLALRPALPGAFQFIKGEVDEYFDSGETHYQFYGTYEESIGGKVHRSKVRIVLSPSPTFPGQWEGWIKLAEMGLVFQLIVPAP